MPGLLSNKNRNPRNDLKRTPSGYFRVRLGIGIVSGSVNPLETPYKALAQHGLGLSLLVLRLITYDNDRGTVDVPMFPRRVRRRVVNVNGPKGR